MKDIHFLNISYNKKKISNLVDSFLLLIKQLSATTQTCFQMKIANKRNTNCSIDNYSIKLNMIPYNMIFHKNMTVLHITTCISKEM